MRLKKLRIFVPDRHDLALINVVRGDRHDEATGHRDNDI
jgi:hypothetical protein